MGAGVTLSWGNSWGTSWADTWGAVAPTPITPAVRQGGGGGPITVGRARRRVSGRGRVRFAVSIPWGRGHVIQNDAEAGLMMLLLD